MGTFCTRLYDHVKPCAIPHRSDDVRHPKYDQDPVVEYSDLLVDAAGVVPRARQNHTLVACGGHRFICYGGFCASIDTDNPLIEVLPREAPGLTSHASCFSVVDNGWSSIFAPEGELPIAARALHSAVCYATHMYVFGDHQKRDSAVHCLDLIDGAWDTLACSGDVPDAFNGHAAVVVGNEGIMLVFGGESRRGVSNQLLAFSCRDHAWTNVKYVLQDKSLAKQLARRDHTMVVLRDQLYVFGGTSPASDTLAFVRFDATRRMWSSLPSSHHGGDGEPTLDASTACGTVSPPPRKGHSCVMHHHYMLLFGGVHRSVYRNDLWVFDCLVECWVEVKHSHQAPPVRRAFAASCTDGVYWYIHGGGNEKCFFRSLMRYDANEIVRQVDPTFRIPDSRWSEKEAMMHEAKHIERRLASVAEAHLMVKPLEMPPRRTLCAIMKTWNTILQASAAIEEEE